MSKLYNKVFFIFALLVVSSCNDLLTEEPTTFYNENHIYNTAEGVETAINGIYYSFSDFEGIGSSYLNIMLPVSGLFYSSQVANIDAAGMNTASNNINLQAWWQNLYRTINAANIAIANLDKAEVTFSNKETALGNAYFLRGKCYLDLLRAFGGVPLRMTPASIDDLHKPRASKDEVIALVISDLEKAKAMMPDAGKTIYGRPSKWAANVYLAKLYMQLAVDQPTYWQKAQDELTPVINAKVFKLLPKYSSLFTPGIENTEEGIFEIQYGQIGGSRTSDIIRLFTPSGSAYAPANVSTFGRLRPNKEVYDNHRARYKDDPRIKATFLFDEFKKADGSAQKIYPKAKSGNQAFTVIAKWFDPNFNGTTSERNYIMLRYADVLLMMAEVVNELQGPDAAYTYVNQVLTRARDENGDGVSDSTTPANWSGMTKEDFRSRIMFERRYELLSEGEEWFDTRRRGYDFLLNNVILPHNNNPTFDVDKDFKYPDDKKNLLLPIPLAELSGNQAIGPEDQNPGY